MFARDKCETYFPPLPLCKFIFCCELLNIFPHPTGNMDFASFIHDAIDLKESLKGRRCFGIRFGGRIIGGFGNRSAFKFFGYARFSPGFFPSQPGNEKMSNNRLIEPSKISFDIIFEGANMFSNTNFLIHPSNQSKTRKKSCKQFSPVPFFCFVRGLTFIVCFESRKTRKQ